ncbi:MAG: hypothetical protein BWY78_00723 [Alphaproteobacteria bacterium ADurb.Bin438]|nr:MAG: hypothetical protein BWY78_00723 [Alphaproteobacteria bacterium ADurb.Bin438]
MKFITSLILSTERARLLTSLLISFIWLITSPVSLLASLTWELMCSIELDNSLVAAVIEAMLLEVSFAAPVTKEAISLVSVELFSICFEKLLSLEAEAAKIPTVELMLFSKVFTNCLNIIILLPITSVASLITVAPCLKAPCKPVVRTFLKYFCFVTYCKDAIASLTNASLRFIIEFTIVFNSFIMPFALLFTILFSKSPLSTALQTSITV